MQEKNSFDLPSLLSVIIPAYKQEKTIYKNILSVESALKTITEKYEIIVVVDGKVDDTYENASKAKSSKIRVVGYARNQGKGNAVRHGMLQAKGDIIGFIDGGMDINPAGFSMLLNHMAWYNADVIVGSKLHPASKVDYPRSRRVLSWGYRAMTRLLFGFKVRDTQVGIKFFKRKVVRQVFPRLLVKRFAFDIEILAVSYDLGFTRIYEAPVEIKFTGASSITSNNFWKIILYMMWDTMAVFYRVKILHYYSNNQNFSVKKMPQSTAFEIEVA